MSWFADLGKTVTTIQRSSLNQLILTNDKHPLAFEKRLGAFQAIKEFWSKFQKFSNDEREPHFSEFPERGQPWEVYPNFRLNEWFIQQLSYFLETFPENFSNI